MLFFYCTCAFLVVVVVVGWRCRVSAFFCSTCASWWVGDGDGDNDGDDDGDAGGGGGGGGA